MRPPTRTTWAALAVLVQLVIVGAAVAAPLSARISGEEVRLRVTMADPVDPFRGAYVDLAYPDLPGRPGTSGLDGGRERLDVAYVPLRRSGVLWVGGAMTDARPGSGPYLACEDQGWRVRCGIESWFLPEGRASALAASLRDGTAVATVKVDGSGHAALVGVATR